MKLWEQTMLTVTTGLLGAGLLVLVNSQPRGEPITLLPPATPAPILVHVDGAVQEPGVYQLVADSRVQQAVDAAGGLLPEAMPAGINLAASLADGDKVLVPYQLAEGGVPGEMGEGGIISQGQVIDLNTASQSQLETLPGIGPQKALDIITYREANGPFTLIEQVMNVPGIGPSTFERIKLYIVVGSAP